MLCAAGLPRLPVSSTGALGCSTGAACWCCFMRLAQGSCSMAGLTYASMLSLDPAPLQAQSSTTFSPCFHVELSKVICCNAATHQAALSHLSKTALTDWRVCANAYTTDRRVITDACTRGVCKPQGGHLMQAHAANADLTCCIRSIIVSYFRPSLTASLGVPHIYTHANAGNNNILTDQTTGIYGTCSSNGNYFLPWYAPSTSTSSSCRTMLLSMSASP